MNGDTVYVWQEQTGDGWGVIVAFIPMVGFHGPLLSRDEAIAQEFGAIARGHGRANGNPIRLARFALEEVIA